MHNNNEEGIVARPRGRRLSGTVPEIAAPRFGVVPAFGTVNRDPDAVPLRAVTEPLPLSPTRLGEPASSLYFQEGMAARSEPPATLLGRLGAGEADAETILR